MISLQDSGKSEYEVQDDVITKKHRAPHTLRVENKIKNQKIILITEC